MLPSRQPTMLPFTSLEKVESKSRHQKRLPLLSDVFKGNNYNHFQTFRLSFLSNKDLTLPQLIFQFVGTSFMSDLRRRLVHLNFKNHKGYTMCQPFNILINKSEHDMPSYYLQNSFLCPSRILHLFIVTFSSPIKLRHCPGPWLGLLISPNIGLPCLPREKEPKEGRAVGRERPLQPLTICLFKD